MSNTAPIRAVRPSTRSRLVAAAAMVALTAAVGASAATLGGVAAEGLGAGTASGLSHPAGVDVRWAPDFGGGSWRVGGIEIATRGGEGFAAGERLRFALLASTGAPLCEFARTIAAPTGVIVIDAEEIAASCGAIAFSGLDRIALAIGS